MRHLIQLALAAVLLASGCTTTDAPRADYQQRAARFLDAAIPILDAYAAAETDPDRLQDFAAARAALEGLRDVATADLSIGTLRDLAPAYQAILEARGDTPKEAADKVALYLLALAALEAAVG